MKLTFLGDITCDRNLLKAGYQDGEYDYKKVFSKVRDIFHQSDIVLGNFETVCAGSNNHYQEQFMTCNAPDELLDAMKWANITTVTTANNHCLDKGIEGLKRTILQLQNRKINYIGTNYSKNTVKRILYEKKGNIIIAFLAYTYSTNESNTGIILNGSNDFYVNLLRPQGTNMGKQYGLKSFLLRLFPNKQKKRIYRCIARIKLRLGIPYMKPRYDRINEGDTENSYLKSVKEDIAEAQKKADYVFVCPHFGGQFNIVPGEYGQFLMNFFKDARVDGVIGNHPHVVQRCEFKKGNLFAYSIGSFNQSISSDYMVKESKPEYSVMIHYYFNDRTKAIDKITFSILKIVEEKTGMITVWPVNDLYKELHEKLDKLKLMDDIKVIYKRFTGKDMGELKNEYEIFYNEIVKGE